MSETTSTSNKETISCWLCDELEQGDTLYQYGADDVKRKTPQIANGVGGENK